MGWWHFIPKVVAWLVAAAWVERAAGALVGLRSLDNLSLAAHDIDPARQVTLTVIVPARNEAADVGACLESLLAQDYAGVTIIAVDDRSTDATGAIMDSLAGPRLRVLHVETLPAGWLGKTHAMALAAAQSTSDFLLFTDADVFFQPDALRRALAYAVGTRADHLVLAPTTIIRRWDEAALITFFQVLGFWAARPWKIADPKARDAMGIGAFNLVRREAYQKIGGFEALRMEIVEDLGLGRRIKRAGLAQRFAFGPGLVNLHWAAGVSGLINVMTKNVFAVFRYSIPLLVVASGWLAISCVLPFVAVFSPWLGVPAAVTICALVLSYFLMGRHTGLSGWNAFLAPLAAMAFIYALLRSMYLTLRQGGVLWRGTFYPLAELRRAVPPLRGSR